MEKLNEEQQRILNYTMKATAALAEIFNEESEHYIGEIDNDHLGELIHALATCAPNMLMSKAVGAQWNNLEFNHIANKLVMQFTHFTDESQLTNNN